MWLSGQIPEVSSFLRLQSWLPFNKLRFSDDDLDWLMLDSDVWELQPGYNRFSDFVKKLTIVNDPAERGVGLIKQFIGSFQNEVSCQENLLAVSKHRKTVTKNSKNMALSHIGVK